MVSNDLPN